MKDKHKLFLIIGIGIFQVVCIIIVFAGLWSEGAVCQKNPYIYVADSFQDWDGEDLYAVCSCSPSTGTIYFDRDGIYNKNPLLGKPGDLINFSILE